MNERELRTHLLEMLRFNALRSMGSAQPSRFRVEEEGDLIWSVDPARLDSYYNRVLGLDRSSIRILERLFAVYAEHGISPQFDMEPGALCDEVSDALSSRGFTPQLNLPFLQQTPIEGTPGEVSVARWGPDRADDFLELLGSSGATCEPSVWAVKRRHYCTDTFRTFVASLDGVPCAWANSLVTGGTAYFANAFTQPAARRRGAHTSLLLARLNDAAALGLETAWTDVEWGSDSHRNCTRRGFELITVHTHWRVPAP